MILQVIFVGVSILNDNNLICKLDAIAKNSHSEILMPTISNAFNTANLNLDNIDLIVCDVGPRFFYRY